jgi:hypothetical protein
MSTRSAPQNWQSTDKFKLEELAINPKKSEQMKGTYADKSIWEAVENAN